MITTLKINVLDEGTKWMTFNHEEEALAYMTMYENDEKQKDDIEVLIDYSEIKHYKEKYDEIYKILMESYTDKEYNSEIKNDKIIYIHKFITSSDDIKSISFTSYEDIAASIRKKDTSTSQILVNISELQDYKEKYDEFYTIILNKYKEIKKVSREVV